MKNIIVLLLILSGSLMTKAQFTGAQISAAGLTCAMCTKAIYNGLGKIQGVENVDVDIKTSSFKLTFAEGAFVDPDQLKKAIEDAGFSVAKLKLTGNFDNLAIGNDAHVTIGGNTYHFLRVNATNLNKEQTLTLVDKNFLTAKEFKKYKSSTNHPCVETGKAEACCTNTGSGGNTRIYHVTI